MKSRFARLLCLAAFTWSLGEAMAADGASPAELEEGRRLIAIISPLDSVENANEVEELVTAVGFQLADLAMTARVTWVDRLPDDESEQKTLARATLQKFGADAVVWLSRRDAIWRFNLLMVSDGTDWLVTRDVAIEDPVALAETLAAITRASVKALTGGAPPPYAAFGSGASSALAAPGALAEATPHAPDRGGAHDATASRAPRRLFAMVGAGYRIGVSASDVRPFHGFEITIGLRFTSFLRVRAAYTAFNRLRVERYGLELDVTRHPVSLALDLTRAWGRLGFDLSIAVEIDYVTREIRAVEPAMVGGPGGGYLQAALAPTIRATVKLVGALSLYVGGGTELFLNRPSYNVTLVQGKKALYSPWPVQPFGCAGLQFEF